MFCRKVLKSTVVAIGVVLSAVGSTATIAQTTPDTVALPAPETPPPARRGAGSVIGGRTLQGGHAVAVTGSGAVWLVGGGDGRSSNRKVYNRVLLARINSSGTVLEHISTFGGNGEYLVSAAAVDGNNRLWICGETSSSSLPGRDAGWNPIYHGKSSSGFISRHSANGNMEWSSYVGGVGHSRCNAMVVNSDGSGYLAGETTALNLPGSNKMRNTGNKTAAFVMAWDAAGAIQWSSFIDGTEKDAATSMARTGTSLWLGGRTDSANLPASTNAWQRSAAGGGDAFIAKLSITTGTVEYLSYIGGSGRDEGLLLSATGENLWFAGTSNSAGFLGNIKSDTDIYAGKWNATAPQWYKVYGGSHRDRVFSISAGAGGDLWLSGMSLSRDFPVSADAAQSQRSRKRDAIVMRVNATTGATEYASYLGGSEAEEGYAVQVAGDAAWVSGVTFSADFPGGGLRLPLRRGDAFIQQYNQSNRNPQLTSTPVTTATAGEDYSYTAEATDQDGDATAWTLLSGPEGMQLTGSTLSWQPAEGGVYSIELEVRDSRGGSTIQSFQLLVFTDSDINSNPQITSTPVTTATVDSTYSYQLQAVDVNRDNLSYSLDVAPLGMTIEADTISWVPADVGSHDVTVRVDDGREGSDTQSYSIEVSYAPGSNPPTLQAVGSHTVELGTSISIQLEGSDIDGDVLSYSVTPLPLPEGASLSMPTGKFTFKPQKAGSYQLDFSVSDGRFSASTRGTFTVPEPVPDAVSMFSGRVLDAQSMFAGEEVALTGVKVSLHGTSYSTTTDSEGRFTLSGYTGGDHVLDLNSINATSSIEGVTYAGFREKIHLRDKVHEREDRAFTLPRLAGQGQTGRVTVNPDGETVLKEENMGIELRIPRGMTRNEDGTPYTGDLYVSEVPRNLAPAALPEFMDPSLLITIQPVGVVFMQPVPITFPNTDDLPPGEVADIWSLDPDTGAFAIVGKAMVSSDGERLETIEGGIRRADWHVAASGTPSRDSPMLPPIPGGDGPCECDEQPVSSAVSLDTGTMSTTVSLPRYRSLGQSRGVSLSYRSNKANPSRVIEMNARVRGRPAYFSYRVEEVGGVAALGQKEMYLNTDNFSRFIRDEPNDFRIAMPFNALDIPTGVYRYRVRQTSHFRLRSVRTTGLGADLGQSTQTNRGTLPPRTREDGSRMSLFVEDRIIIDNKSRSPYGAGWEVNGVYSISEGIDGGLLLQIPGSASVHYVKDDDGNFISPGVYYTTLTEEQDAEGNTTGYRLLNKSGIVRYFDAEGRLQYTEDRNGNRSSYSYQAYKSQGDNSDSYRLTTITDPVGRQTNFRYSDGYLEEIEDPAGRVSRFRHSAHGDLVEIIYPDNSSKNFSYDEHRMVSKRDERGNTTSYSYSAHGQLVNVTLPDATERNITNRSQIGIMADDEGSRSEPGKATVLAKVRSRYADARGNPVLETLDADGYPLVTIDSAGRETIMERDDKSNVTREVRPNGSAANMDYDTQGNTMRREEEFNGAVTSYEYNQFSQVTSMTNPRGNTMRHEYDSKGNQTRTINPLGHTTTMEYNTQGLVTRTQSPNNLVTTYQYNNHGLMETMTQTPPQGSPGGTRTTSYTYHPTGLMASMTTPEGVTYQYSYDERSRRTKVRDNAGQETLYSYNPYGNMVRTEMKNSDGSIATWTTTEYDSRNRNASTTIPHKGAENSTWRTLYDNESNVAATTDPAGNVDRMQHDSINRLTGSVHRLNGNTSYEYDKLSRLTKVTAPTGIETSYEYDSIGRLMAEHSADRGTTRYKYDIADNMVQRITARGITETYSYDQLERPVSVKYPNTHQGKNENVTYSYDNCTFGTGRLCRAEDESGTTALSYDAFGNVLSQIHTELGVNYTTSYVWDKENKLSQLTLPSGRIIDYSRDSVRRVSGITTTVNGISQSIVSNISYRADNMMLGCTYGNGLNDSRSYDLQGRLLTQKLSGTSGTVDQRTYSYDVKSNITAIEINGRNLAYSYDALDRLISEAEGQDDTTSYSYDLNHNRLQKSGDDTTEIYRHQEAANRLLQRNETGQSLPEPKADVRYEYNDAGRIWRYHEADRLVEYIYNAEGQRTRKILYNAEGTITQTIIYHWSMGMLVEETTATGELIRDYIPGTSYMPVAQIDVQQSTDGNSTEQISYLYADHLDTPRLATNNSQAVVWRWDSDAFGDGTPVLTTIAGRQDTVINLRFPGQYYDAESGLHYNYHRYYDSSTGRYVTSDLVGLLGGLNPFAYVEGNPINFTDPLGLFPCDLWFWMGVDWVLGRDPQYRVYRDFTDQVEGVRKLPQVKEAKENFKKKNADELNKKCCDPSKLLEYDNHDAEDMGSWLSPSKPCAFKFIGSFRVDIYPTTYSCNIVNIRVTNNSSFESATRYITGDSGVSWDSGYMRNMHQTYSWQENL